MSQIESETKLIDEIPVIVIGSGLGGLGAACQLAVLDEKVLLLEKHNVPGGFATSFVRGRFEFEGALHMLSDIGTNENQGALYRFLKRIGLVPEHLKFKQVPEFYRSVFFDGYDITIPYGIEEYFDKLQELFPSEKEEIEKFKEICLATYEGIKYVGKKRGKVSPQEILKEHPWLARVAGLTLKDVFDKCFTNKKLIAVISQPWGFLGLPPSGVSAYSFIGMIMIYLGWGGAYPVGRSHSLTSGMAKVFQELGGKIRFNALVNRILVKNGKVYGVELQNGDVYNCNAVISNVNPICTTMKMLPPESVSEQYKRKIFAPHVGPSGFSVYIGLNGTPEDFGLNAHETFINATYDLDEAYKGFTMIDEPKYIVAACYNNIDPTITPLGTCQLVLTTLQMGHLWHSIPPDKYVSVKNNFANKMISMVEKTIFPEIRKHIEVAEVASPLTYYRYSKNYDGAIYGYNQDVITSPMFRLNSKGPVKGLYLAGAWTNMGGGFSTSILGGRIAAGMYISDKREGKI